MTLFKSIKGKRPWKITEKSLTRAKIASTLGLNENEFGITCLKDEAGNKTNKVREIKVCYQTTTETIEKIPCKKGNDTCVLGPDNLLAFPGWENKGQKRVTAKTNLR
jgi:hypothetical protein